MRVEWSNFARDDLDILVQYISRNSSFYARRFGEKIVLATQQPGDFPERGHIFQKLKIKNYEESSYGDIA